MPSDSTLVFIALGLALALFGWGKIRYDIVALITLLLLVLPGIVPAADAFTGFGHPAVITVGAVLIISRALQNSGLVDVIAQWVFKVGTNIIVQLLVLSAVVALASAFMNNIGALAILLPVVIQLARKSGHPPSYLLMPVAFASLLGGMTTLIGTPPNIIIATFRGEEFGEPFGLFDFSPVGAGVAVIGILFIALLGWRLLPKRVGDASPEERFHIEDYITEVRITKDSTLKGKTLGKIQQITDTKVSVLGLIRSRQLTYAPESSTVLKTNDILVIEADSDDLQKFLENSKAKLESGRKFRKDAIGADEIAVVEAVITADSPLIGSSASDQRLRSRFGVNLLAIARQEKQIRRRLDKIRLRAGDVLLLQGRQHNLHESILAMGCLPLAERGLRLGQPKRILVAVGIFGAAIASVVAGLLPVQIAFALAAVALVLAKAIALQEIYTSVDWPVIMLLGAMIPVGTALETSGGAEIIAAGILNLGSTLPPWGTLAILLVVTMFLSDLINNAATVLLMAPIGISIATGLGASIDPFLMAIAVGGSCAFLTPIGHQSNTLVMGPGGYKFLDYWRMGLPLELLIVLVGVPLIIFFWPL